MDKNLDGTVTDDNETRLEEAISLAKSYKYTAARGILYQILDEEPDNYEALDVLSYIKSDERMSGVGRKVNLVVNAVELVIGVIGFASVIWLIYATFEILRSCS